MKNLIGISDREEIIGYVGGLWRSDLFRDSHSRRGFVYEAVEKFAWLPRLFAETSNDYLERAHFSTWWNVIMLRDYDNPVIHDLYYLHEMTHATTMPYVPGIGRAAFDEKMQRNELEASVLSEIAIYFYLPALRGSSFQHAIYADRFLGDHDIQSLWASNPQVALETIRSMRRDAMVSKVEHTMDRTEKWIRRFAEQNTAYAITWSDRYNEVELHMRELQVQASINRANALMHYRDWLETQAAFDTVDNIPFRQEAELFSPFYWANKAKYDADFAH